VSRGFYLWIYETIGRTPWMGDRTDTRPLPTHRTTQHRETQAHIHAPSRIRTCDLNIRATEDSTCLRPLIVLFHIQLLCILNLCPSVYFILPDENRTCSQSVTDSKLKPRLQAVGLTRAHFYRGPQSVGRSRVAIDLSASAHTVSPRQDWLHISAFPVANISFRSRLWGVW
jgi:hypothetical protein